MLHKGVEDEKCGLYKSPNVHLNPHFFTFFLHFFFLPYFLFVFLCTLLVLITLFCYANCNSSSPSCYLPSPCCLSLPCCLMLPPSCLLLPCYYFSWLPCYSSSNYCWCHHLVANVTLLMFVITLLLFIITFSVPSSTCYCCSSLYLSFPYCC